MITLDPENNIFIKIFDNDLICRDIQYEIGKEYTLDDSSKLKTYKFGFDVL